MKKKVLILAHSTINRDPRVLKQIAFFQVEGFEITLSSLGYEGDCRHYPMIKPKKIFFRFLKGFILLFRLKKIRVWEYLYHSSLDTLIKESPFFDLIIANDSETWPLAAHLKQSHPETKVIFDAHEYYPLQFEDKFWWAFIQEHFDRYVCKTYISQSDYLLTVCQGIGDSYKKEFEKEALIVLNTPDYFPDLKPLPVGDTVRIIHHGIANRSRKIESMIEMMDYLEPRFHLSLMLMPSDPEYLAKLKTLAKGKHVDFLDPIPTKEIPAFINKFDIGLFLLEPVNFNYTHALPNKFFEFIQARLAIAIGPSKEMMGIVIKNQLGVVGDDFKALNLATKLNSLTNSDIMEFKKNADKVASLYSSEQNKKIYRKLISELFPKVYA